MKTIHYFGILLLSTGLFVACSTDGNNESENKVDTIGMEVDTAGFLQDLAALESRIDMSTDIPKEKDLNEAISKFQDFAAIFPNDPQAPDYLLRASDICLTMDQPEKSVKILNRIIDNYPDYKRMEDVKYNHASHLDFELRDTSAAKEAYQVFIDEYPNSPLVSDCQSRIKNIQYSAEELAEKFLQELETNGGELPTTP